MKKHTRTLIAIVLFFAILVAEGAFDGRAACKHERMCYENECVHCGKTYSGSNTIHSGLSRYWTSNNTRHWQYCSDCGELLSEGEHWNFCCEPIGGITTCFDCYAEYSPINIVHHMWETDEGVPFCCCGECGSYEDAQGTTSHNYRTDYLYKNSEPLFETIELGSFEQDNDYGNGKEPIQWYILYSDSEKALLLSRFALINMNFNKTYKNVSWDYSTIRSWLNDSFYNDAFTYGEQKVILSKQGSDRYSYNGYGNIATSDKVFLLSLDEVNYYFDNALRRQVIATPYAKANGIQVKDGYSWWWLRSMGDSNLIAQFVFENGSISTIGRDVSSYVGGVRPAIWVDVSLLR